jgi:hypothetical protein
MVDGEHYIRGLSDNELEKFVGLNRNMYTKQELQIADNEMAERKRARVAGAAAETKPTAAGQPPVEPPKPASAEIRPVKRPEPKADSPAPGEPYMYCIHCGRKLALKADYCTQCGKRVALEDETIDIKSFSPKRGYQGAARRPAASGMNSWNRYNDDSCDSCCNPRI